MIDAASSTSSKIDTKAFFAPGAIDALLEMAIALGSEISAVSEKLDTVIDLLARQGVTRQEEVENFTPDADQQSRRDRTRQRLVQSLLAPYQLQAEALAASATRETPR